MKEINTLQNEIHEFLGEIMFETIEYPGLKDLLEKRFNSERFPSIKFGNVEKFDSGFYFDCFYEGKVNRITLTKNGNIVKI